MRGLSSRNSASALLPEFAMVEPVWESEHFDPARWSAIEILNAMHLRHLADLRARVRGGHATGDPGWAPLESGMPLVCC